MTRASRWMLAGVAAMVTAGCGRKDAAPPRATPASDSGVAAELRQAADTAAFSEAADVAMRDIPDSTLPMPPKRTMVAHGTRQPAAPSAAPARTTMSSREGRTVPAPMRPTPPSDVRPAVPAPVAPVTAARPAAPATSAADGASPGDPSSCASPSLPDQRRCLMAFLARSDVGLDRAYQQRIRQLRAEAGTPAGAPEPESVQRLRTAQRAWLVYRDTECRNRNRGREGPLWAPVRARCLGEFSQARAAELGR